MRRRAVFVVVAVLFLSLTARPVAGNEQLARVKAVGECMDQITLMLKQLTTEYLRVGARPSSAALKAAQQWARILHTKVFLLVLELGDLNVKMTKPEILAKVDEALRKCSVANAP